MVDAALSKGSDKQLETATTNQGGGTISSSKFRQQSSVGGAVAGNRITSSRFRIIPGFLGSSLSAPVPPLVAELDLSVLYAKIAPLGERITPAAWQTDNDPIFIWEPPPTGPEVAGYSYALDKEPDEQIDTTSTSLDLATQPLGTLADGKHTFAVKAVNSAGTTGKAITFEIWADTTPPQITTYSPTPGTLLNTVAPTVTATLLDASSGVNIAVTKLFVNGSETSFTFNEATGVVTSTGGAWKEGTNTLRLSDATGRNGIEDLVGNALAPLIWNVTVDTKPPTGTLAINGGSAMTTSVYVTLSMSASDATSGVARMLISNDELGGYVEEPYAALRELWKLNPIRGTRTVYVKLIDTAGNISAPVAASIELGLLAPDTVITGGPAGTTPTRSATFTFMCPESDCVFSFAFDNDEWSDWSATATAARADLVFGNHYFRVKAAKEANGIAGIQPDEEDPAPAERTWVVGVEPSLFIVPKGPPIKLWRLE